MGKGVPPEQGRRRRRAADSDCPTSRTRGRMLSVGVGDQFPRTRHKVFHPSLPNLLSEKLGSISGLCSLEQEARVGGQECG